MMDELDKNELIEHYIEGSLPPAEQAAVEARMVTDEAFRAEVELHRQLQAEFEDPRKLALRAMLREIVEEPPTDGHRPNHRIKWAVLSGAALVATALGLYFFWPERETAPPPATQQEIKTPASVDSFQDQPNKLPPSAPTLKESNQPIAMTAPADFAPNPVFEKRLGANIRDSDAPAELKSPAPSARFTLRDGFATIHFRGVAPANADTAQHPLILKIYNNRLVADEVLFRIFPEINNRTPGAEKWNFSTTERLRLPPGLYYFTLERQADEDLIFTGKFIVEGR